MVIRNIVLAAAFASLPIAAQAQTYYQTPPQWQQQQQLNQYLQTNPYLNPPYRNYVPATPYGTYYHNDPSELYRSYQNYRSYQYSNPNNY
jgi:hypothetical protein